MENEASDTPSITDLEAMFLAEDFDIPNDVAPTLSDPQNDKHNNSSGPRIFEDHNFLKSDNPTNNEETTNASASSAKVSVVHKGDTDSSDDEDERNYLERKYSEYGKQIKTVLDREAFNKKDKELEYLASSSNTTTGNGIKPVSKMMNTKHELSVAKPAKSEVKVDIHTDPVFGIRIINPLISSAMLLEKMKGREPITMAKVRKHTELGDLSKDWVIAGAIINKSPVKTSQKGNQFCIWLLSDLRDDLKTVSLFLFKNAHKDLWKTAQGTVIGVLNPGVLDRRDDSKDEATLSIDNSQKIMIFGQSKDLGICKSRKKNGDPCTAFVNLHQCEHCIYHVKQVYQQASRRSELQSACAGRGLNSLRNKVLGKSEVFYAGQSFTAVPALKNRKQMAKDRSRIDSLSDYNRASNSSTAIMNREIASAVQAANKLNASRVEHSVKQREKDMERLRILKSTTEKIETPLSPIENKEANVEPTVKPTNRFLNAMATNQRASVPKLSCGSGRNSDIDLSAPIRKAQQTRAKLNALSWVQKNGPIKKVNPANLKGTQTGKKRAMEQLHEISSNKKMKTTEQDTTGVKSERFKKLMAATSVNVHLLEQHEEEKREQYFNKLEKREQMEEKMIGTFKVACKAVRCIVCNYTSFSASSKCKELKHPLRVYDSFKRFFKCLDCKNRTVTLDLLPKVSCKNCQGSRWQKTGMMDEKIIKTAGEVLSIRGDEEQFIGAAAVGGNINLLVPDSV